jgi:hypothetical protein
VAKQQDRELLRISLKPDKRCLRHDGDLEFGATCLPGSLKVRMMDSHERWAPACFAIPCDERNLSKHNIPRRH